MPHLPSLLTLFATAVCLAAQTFTYPLNPRSTYLRTNNDSPLPPLVLDLAQLGIQPGAWLRIGTVGSFSYISGGADTYRNLVAVFSADATLLSTSVQHRVPGAIAAGPWCASAATFYGNLPLDIPEDFFASRNLWSDNVLVEVPAGALRLFLGTHDSWYSDNTDPNGDFAAVITALPSPGLPGTGEHLELRAGVGSPVAAPDVHAAPMGASMVAQLRYPVGHADGSLYVFVADTMPTGGQPPQALPRVWLANLLIVQFGLLPGTAGWTDTWTLSAPGGLIGTTLILQAGALVPTARNGFYETTNAHRFVLQ